MTDAYTPVVLTIAGSDSGGGAGIQADLKTFQAFGTFGTSVITCVTAQNLQGVSHIQPLSTESITAQIKAVLGGFTVLALKTGMLFSREIITTVAKSLHDFKGHIVVDPVMVARSGDVLLQQDAIAAYENELFPLAKVITPNLHEAAVLLQADVASLTSERAAGELFQKYNIPVVVKGTASNDKTDCYVDERGEKSFSAPLATNVHTHGTGCSYSASVAAFLAQGDWLHNALYKAKKGISARLNNPIELSEGTRVLSFR
jgi:hydroxymethylpyrimidine/phosphomethylpyrimidine kinase